MMTVYRPLDSYGTLMQAKRAAEALVTYLSDPVKIAALVAAEPGIEVGIASVESVKDYHIVAKLDERGRLFVIATELGGE